MAESVSRLMLDFLAWVSSRPRTYHEAMEAWQSTCPRHTTWEDAIIAGLIEVRGEGDQAAVRLTPRGEEFLESHAGESRPVTAPAAIGAVRPKSY